MGRFISSLECIEISGEADIRHRIAPVGEIIEIKECRAPEISHGINHKEAVNTKETLKGT